MDINTRILSQLEKQRDIIFENLEGTSISRLYKEEYDDIKAGRVYIMDNQEQQMLIDLKKLSKDTSRDNLYKNKLSQYLMLDNNALISYFEIELEKKLHEIKISGKHQEIQAIFIEYDFYYHFFGDIYCFGKQEYPLLEEPRYISGEFDYQKKILFLDNGINFQPAWIDCEEFAELDYLDIEFSLQNLFQLHSRVLLHMALEKINLKNTMNFFQNRPFTFYINEHDCEVMTLFRLN